MPKATPAGQRLAPSKSYHQFESVIHRSLNLLSLWEILQKRANQVGIRGIDFSDLIRAAIVLSVSAMDAYFTRVFAERLVPFLKKRGPTKDLVTLLSKAGLTTDVALELLTMERPYRRIRALVDGHLERHTAQKIEVIDDLFAAYGVEGLCARVQELKGRKTLLRSVRKAVERRHSIVHEGDLNAHGRQEAIDVRWARNRVLDVQKLVAGADEILRRQLRGR